VVVATALNEFIVNIVFQITAFIFPQHRLGNLLGAREQSIVLLKMSFSFRLAWSELTLGLDAILIVFNSTSFLGALGQ
jgi:hypothetical protein